MMNNRRVCAILLTLALACSLPFAALAETRLDKVLSSGKLTVATSPDFAPSEFIDPTKTGQEAIVGREMLLARYIAAELGVELVIESMDFSAVQGAVAQAKVDLGISGFSPTPERAESMELSDSYTFEEVEHEQGFLVLKADIDKYAALEDFAGKKIAAQNGSLQQTLVTTQTPDAKIELITSLNDAVMMLITGKVDALATAVTVGEEFAANYPDIQIANTYFDYRSPGNVVMATKGEVELIAKVNEIIAKAVEEGKMEQWVEEIAELTESLAINSEE
ncbi:MAG: transporter substrate-binding domain-containing protein [Oscillospiraceae bacterium]|jgi:polar amino acid transport system substrate-binding protein|nr:transporter substrate-binding domain-containing protein [Oscillospiraceae bacterium]